ncbi:hypothetical protein [Parendozoicomonas sp. Alg238-R29]|uniref:hypothetical protein n=1 Tax=Parendozoicomonas sp. Alg238-R29 TaxID=2993446 RepID=UPI00248E69FC|nr:hypothetical protein [Parendozoicomonas sp. Alg238-R29]
MGAQSQHSAQQKPPAGQVINRRKLGDLVACISYANKGHCIGWTCKRENGVWESTCSGRPVKGLKGVAA